MGWKCFKFWFTFRLLLALLAHFNWATAFYMKCMYFTLWKSYDLLWFWMHFILCICFKPLRPENYLLVWINLLRHKRTYPEKNYRQLYNMLYNTRFTKSERELKSIETEEQKEDQDSDEENGLGVIDENGDGSLYPTLKNQPKVHIRLQKDNNEDDALLESGKNPESSNGNDSDKKSASSNILGKALPSILKKKWNLGDKPEQKSPDDDNKSGKWTEKIGLKKLIPDKFARSVSNDGSANDEQEKLEKQRLKEAKRIEKTKNKEERRLRKVELRKRALIERRRRNIADSIDLMLQCLRSFSGFALLVGNIHRHFMIASPYVNANESVYNDPDLMMLFTITMSLDIFLFWGTLFMTYCQQCKLCCRLGICKFWLWLAVLLSLMFGVMYSPMHYVQQQLDPTWCVFMPGTDLEVFSNAVNDGLAG